MICKKYNIKIVYFSSNYVYPGTKGNYKETDPVLPLITMAGQSSGESLLFTCIRTLILRICMTENLHT